MLYLYFYIIACLKKKKKSSKLGVTSEFFSCRIVEGNAHVVTIKNVHCQKCDGPVYIHIKMYVYTCNMHEIYPTACV